jgi:hypothetical protein
MNCLSIWNAMVRFTLSTGLSESNVTGLQWDQIDMKRRFGGYSATDWQA